jgi:hypothetical protein
MSQTKQQPKPITERPEYVCLDFFDALSKGRLEEAVAAQKKLRKLGWRLEKDEEES